MDSMTVLQGSTCTTFEGWGEDKSSCCRPRQVSRLGVVVAGGGGGDDEVEEDFDVSTQPSATFGDGDNEDCGWKRLYHHPSMVRPVFSRIGLDTGKPNLKVPVFLFETTPTQQNT
jgi:hypothetical protein